MGAAPVTTRGVAPFVALLALLVAPLLAARPTAAQPPNRGIEVLGQLGGAVGRPAVQGSYAYVRTGPRLQVLDLSDPARPRLVGESAPLGYSLFDLAVQGRYAYAAAGDSGLRVFDVGDPTRPVEVGSYAPPGSFGAVAVAGSRVYLSGSGLRILDVSDPTHPVELGAHLGAGGTAIAVAGNYFYSAPDYDPNGDTLHVWYVAYPKDVTRVGAYQPARYTAGRVRAIALAGSYAFLAEESAYTPSGGVAGGGLRVLNVADPSRPTDAGLLHVPGWPRDVEAADGRVYLVAISREVGAGNSAEPGGLHVIDVSDPLRPAEVGARQGGEFATVAAQGTNVLVVDGRGLHVVDVSTPSRAAEIGSYSSPPPQPRTVAVDGTVVYALDQPYPPVDATLRIVDASDPARMRLRSSLALGRGTGDLVASGGFVYVGQAGLRVIDARDPGAPVDLGLAPGSAEAAGGRTTASLALAGRYLYAAEGDAPGVSGGVRVYDLADPARPRTVRFLAVGPVGTPRVAVAGAALAVQAYGGFRLFDLSDPANPIEGGELPAGPSYASPSGLGAAGRYVYLGWGWQILHGGFFQRYVDVVDVSDPRQPRRVAAYPEAARQADAAGDLSYFLDYEELRVWANPACPTLVASFSLGALDAAASGDRVYVAADGFGLYALRVAPQDATCRRIYLPLGT